MATYELKLEVYGTSWGEKRKKERIIEMTSTHRISNRGLLRPFATPSPFLSQRSQKQDTLSYNRSVANMQLSPTHPIHPRKMYLFGKVEVIVQPLAGIDPGNVQTGSAVGQRRVEAKAPDSGSQNDYGSQPSGDERPRAHALLGRDKSPHAATDPTLGLARGIIHGVRGRARVKRLQIEDELDQSTSDHSRCQMRRQIVVEEALTAHQPEGEIVSGPAQEEEASAVVQTRTGTWAPD